ncbi:MAG: FAD-dependent oxidoreductase [Burkholderiaceae bacterium]|nr:FAD-dependent oxidoreductase [Burkholderiaceae bacterium]MDO9090055.1 FAD-dependent oxidoreductase [Burkholderiaceae bacterium]MDP1967600.1 FAD-dependent oxidoreductase [Burkholderiaceae bacterium]
MYKGIRKLVLLGAGPAHLEVLLRLARQHPADLDVTLVCPHPFHVNAAMVPRFVAGGVSLEECQVPLEPLFKAAGVRWVQGRCESIDAGQRRLKVAGDPGLDLSYDVLGLDTGADPDRQRLEASIPGAAIHALLTRPLAQFTALWPRVVELAQQRPLSVGVIGAGRTAIELALAAHERLSGSRFTLLTGGGEIVPHAPAPLRQRVTEALKRRNITVLRAACTGVAEGELRMEGDATLACDVPLLAVGGLAPGWLSGSGLAQDADGHALIESGLNSASHPEVFIAPDLGHRTGEHCGGDALAQRAAALLAVNLLAAVEGAPPRSLPVCTNELLLWSCGAHRAFAQWGPMGAQGRLIGWWKNRRDKAALRRSRSVHG